eukprot:9306599-Alexandrium_andersonii.AAC.1
MSASLVGSEMCIRDRLRSLCGQGVDLGICQNFCLGGDSKVAFFKQEAVSYTHLTLPTICSV